MNASTDLLLVEDDPSVAATLIDGLQGAGYRVHWEQTGAGGLEYARRHHPALIILDVQLPDGSGFDVCRQIRSWKLFPPVLMLTVQDDPLDRVLGLEMGADDYVVKPFHWRELLSRIRALLRRAYGEFAESGSVLYAGDLIIDLNRGSVERDDQTIDLTPTEFRLLVHLAQHPGQVFSRSQLLQSVWEYPPSTDNERMVTVYIHRLREKVELNPTEPALIKTVPGLGYRLTR